MKRVLIALVAAVGIAWSVSPAQGQAPKKPGLPFCAPGQAANPLYCELPPNCGKFTSKLSLLRATFFRLERTISILAPITHRASGVAGIQLHAARTRTNFEADVDGPNGRIRVTQAIPRAQAVMGTGILTIRYPGDPDTRLQTVRLRAANHKALLTARRPTISPLGFLQTGGTISRKARGIVRTQLEYVNRADGEVVTLERAALISKGKWSLNSELTPSIRSQIAKRCGTVHSYILFTGYLPRRMRGEMRNYEVLPSI